MPSIDVVMDVMGDVASPRWGGQGQEKEAEATRWTVPPTGDTSSVPPSPGSAIATNHFLLHPVMVSTCMAGKGRWLLPLLGGHWVEFSELDSWTGDWLEGGAVCSEGEDAKWGLVPQKCARSTPIPQDLPCPGPRVTSGDSDLGHPPTWLSTLAERGGAATSRTPRQHT